MSTDKAPSLLSAILVGAAILVLVFFLTNVGCVIVLADRVIHIPDYLPLIDPSYFVVAVGCVLIAQHLLRKIRGAFLLDGMEYRGEVVLFRRVRGGVVSALGGIEVRNIAPGQPGIESQVLYKPLTSLFQTLSDKTECAFEVAIRQQITKIRFYVFQKIVDSNDVKPLVSQELRKIEDAFRSCYHGVEFRRIPASSLRETFNDITGGEALDFDLKQHLLLLTAEGAGFFSVLRLKGVPSKASLGPRQLDLLIQNALRMKSKIHFVIAFRPRKLNWATRRILVRRLLQGKSFSRLPSLSLEESLCEGGSTVSTIGTDYSLSAVWQTSAYVCIQNDEEAAHVEALERLRATLINVFGSVNSGFHVDILDPKAVVKKIGRLLTRGPLSDHGLTLLTSNELSSYIHMPEKIAPGIECTRVPVFQVPPQLHGSLMLGDVVFNGDSVYPVAISSDDLRLHTVVLGQTGFGKSHFVFNLIRQLLQVEKEVNWILMDWKGEYLGLLSETDAHVVVFRPGSPNDPFRLNLFDPRGQSPEEYAQHIFEIINETLSSLFDAPAYELSAQMKRVFRDVLVDTVVDKKKRSLSSFFNALQEYRNPLMPNLNATVEALRARILRLSVGCMGRVFGDASNPVSVSSLVKDKVIIDLSYLKQNASLSDVRFFMNILTKQIFNFWFEKGKSDRLEYLLFLEEAQYLLPEILLKRTAIDLTAIESAAHSIRDVGVGLVSIATRPILSHHILANSALKIVFRSGYESDKIGRVLGLTEEQEQYLKSLPRQRAICQHPEWPHPFLLQVSDSIMPRGSERQVVLSRHSFVKKHRHETGTEILVQDTPGIFTGRDDVFETKREKAVCAHVEAGLVEDKKGLYQERILKMLFDGQVLSLDEIAYRLRLTSVNRLNDVLKSLSEQERVKMAVVPNWGDPDSTTRIYCRASLEKDLVKAYMRRVFLGLCREKGLVVDEDVTLFDCVIDNSCPLAVLSEEEAHNPRKVYDKIAGLVDHAKRLNAVYLILLLPVSVKEYGVPYDCESEQGVDVLLVPFAQTAYQQVILALKQKKRELLRAFAASSSKL
ncbi:MAG: ATP-binding protein [Candidatus Ranarchaeia archaeon]